VPDGRVRVGRAKRSISRRWLVQQLKDESRIPARQVDACVGLNDGTGAFRGGLHDELVDRHTDRSRSFFQLVDDGLRHARRVDNARELGLDD